MAPVDAARVAALLRAGPLRCWRLLKTLCELACGRHCGAALRLDWGRSRAQRAPRLRHGYRDVPGGRCCLGSPGPLCGSASDVVLRP